EDRRDRMVAGAASVVDVRDRVRGVDGARGTVGRIMPVRGGTNVIASRVDVWLDVRHPDDYVTRALVATIHERARGIAHAEGCEVVLVEESYSGSVYFDGGLRDRLATMLPDAPVLDTGAGHDAGVLSAVVPTAMLFTRNPTGISHSPEEDIEDADGELGAEALADVLQGLRTRA
ncbi:MAG: allantoate amidohydrolase, partial [Aeromicrobium sp.]|nr:allantoate amidohydrolase [Aeromicrobium sp.]